MKACRTCLDKIGGEQTCESGMFAPNLVCEICGSSTPSLSLVRASYVRHLIEKVKMLICDSCLECCHIEDHHEEPILISTFNHCRCSLCKEHCGRLYEMEKEHIQELLRKYKELLNKLDLNKLLDP